MFEDEPSPRPRDDEVAIDLCLQALKLNPDSATALRKLRALETSVAKKKRPIDPRLTNAATYRSSGSSVCSMKDRKSSGC